VYAHGPGNFSRLGVVKFNADKPYYKYMYDAVAERLGLLGRSSADDIPNNPSHSKVPSKC
jgi:hypothetical protein